MKTNVVAIIAARGGSKGVPGKNLRLIAGKPLIAYSIEAAKGCQLIDRIIVSTENSEIAETARKYGAETPFVRPDELAQDNTPTEPVLKHTIEWLEENDQYKVDIMVFLQPTDIFRKKYMLTDVIQCLLDNEEIDSAFVAYPTHKNFWRKKDGKYVRLAPDIKYGPRQSREHLFREDTGLACATRAKFVKMGKRLGPNVEIIENPEETSAIDLHNEFDFWLAEKVITEWGITIND